jgi:adenylylsulfate kinase-like enzyme
VRVIIWINGGFGAGKTTLAGELHRRLADEVLARAGLGQVHRDGKRTRQARSLGSKET